MGTRIQDKSRPTKRPMAYLGGTPSAYVKVRSGKPKIDKKGYPRTEGLSVPVLVDGSYPVGPAGTVFLGRWNVGDPANTGEFSFIYPTFQINDVDQGGTNHNADFLTLTAGDTVYFATPTGANTLTVASVADSGASVTITVNAEAPNGIIDDGQLAAVWITDPGTVVVGLYDPSQHTVTEVQDHVTTNHLDGSGDPATPADLVEIQRILDEERAGLNRATLVAWLDSIQGVV